MIIIIVVIAAVVVVVVVKMVGYYNLLEFTSVGISY